MWNRSTRLLAGASLLVLAFGTLAQEAPRPGDIPAAVFAALPLMSDVEISPDGTRLAFLTPKDGRRQLVIRGLLAGVAPVVVPAIEELDFLWLRWANNERLVFAMSYLGKRWVTETVETRLLAIDKDGLNIARIIKPSTQVDLGSRVAKELPPAQLQDDVVDWLVNDPDHILVSLDGDADGQHEVRLVDIRDGSFKLVQKGLRGVQNWIVDQRSELRIGYGYDQNERIFRLKQSNGEWVTTAGANWPLGEFLPHAFTPDAAVAYGYGPSETGRYVVRKMQLSSGEFLETVLERDGFDVDGLVEDPVTGIPVGVAYTEHLPHVHYFDETMDRLQQSVDSVLKNTSNALVSMSGDRQRVVILSSSDVEPGIYYLWDRAEKSINIIGEVHPGLNASVLAPVEAASYAARDGVAIPAYLTVPLGAERRQLPTVVMPHGGPGARDTQAFDFVAQFLASRGYAVLQPNFRGSSGYGRAFAAAGKGQWGGLMQDDVSDGAEWLVEQGIADAARLCIVGWSYGGYSAAMGAVKTPELFRCAASINGVLDLVRQISEDKKYIGGSVWTKHMGLDGEKAKTVSPYDQAERIRIPMLIVQAKDDARVTSEQGQRMASRLKKLGKPVEFLEVAAGGHSLNNEASRLAMLNSLESFLAANIGAKN